MDLTRDPDGKPLFEKTKEQAIKDRFFDMVCMMAWLRKGCPWDREQTPDSLKRYILEEAYEVLETIEEGDWDALREELGDFVFQVVFQAQIQADEGRWDIEHVLAGLVEKMVRRHPHVFEQEELTAEQVSHNWEALKQQEKGPKESIYDGFTRGLPALLESYKIAKKAAKVGFDWENTDQVLDKIEEETAELREAVHESPERVAEELGDLMFAVSNLVRKHGFEPEETLRLANRKFMNRFRKMEKLAGAQGRALSEMDIQAKEALWQQAKRM
ncbi:MAG: nucleoside triphosphate pyrophosphohydrolase [Acidobacteriota bacterium]|nr:nucleoside triphosphate pyrophosphohydrolase [Acidobacteriota bacterium]